MINLLTEPNAYDVFLCHSSEDKIEVRSIAEELKKRGFNPLYDPKEKIPGVIWQKMFEDNIAKIQYVIIFIGKSGLSSGQDYEIKIILQKSIAPTPNLQVAILPSVSKNPNIPHILEFVPVVDLRNLKHDFIDVLIKGITAEDAENTPPLRSKKIIHLPDIDWIEIPAGTFLVGHPPETSKEIERFYISRYPITNIQYQAFIDAGGYQEERWWKYLDKPEPQPPTWSADNRPRERINFFEAIAFCRWFSTYVNIETTLPTALQWEKAARGTGGRLYPWGNRYQMGDANVFDSSAGDENLEQTTAVGVYLHHASPYGVQDMAGNILEWCLPSGYTNFKQHDLDLCELSGGSWLDVPGNATCIARHLMTPETRDSRIGFRVVSFPK